MSSIKTTAEKIAKEWIEKWDQDDDPLVAAIEKALRDERERAAKIADEELKQSDAPAAYRIAAAIRRERTD